MFLFTNKTFLLVVYVIDFKSEISPRNKKKHKKHKGSVTFAMDKCPD